jgi:hypothetical protein
MSVFPSPLYSGERVRVRGVFGFEIYDLRSEI